MRRPRLIIKQAIIVVAVSAVGFSAARLPRYLYSMEYHNAVAELRKFRGIVNIHIHGFDDLTYELTRQTFSIAGRPDAVFHVIAAQNVLTEKPNHIWIFSMGPWQFSETC